VGIGGSGGDGDRLSSLFGQEKVKSYDSETKQDSVYSFSGLSAKIA
jgi:hypothetical protein